MRDDVENNSLIGCMEVVMGVALGLVACLVISLCSCRAQKEVERIEVPVVVTQEHTVESVKIDHIRDTLIQRDSIFHYIKGDTTIIERWHYLQGTTNITKVDTLHIYDSVPYPVTTEKTTTKIEKVNVLHWWQKVLIAIGGGALIALILFAAYKMGKKRLP